MFKYYSSYCCYYYYQNWYNSPICSEIKVREGVYKEVTVVKYMFSVSNYDGYNLMDTG